MFKRISLSLVILYVFAFQIASAQEYEYGEDINQARVLRDKDFKNALKSPLELEDFPYFTSLDYFANSAMYKVTARFIRTPSEKKFEMPTMNGKSKTAVKYAEVKFNLNGREHTLSVYQLEKLMNDEKYKNYLFIPFKDLTNGKGTYGAGRYIDLIIPDKDTITIDFNRAYNPSCAYNKTKFSCPVPPAENNLKTRIEAGEKNYPYIVKKISDNVIPQSRFASFENNKVHYINSGAGETALIFIHGWTCNAEFWKRSYTAFRNIRVIAVDLPGHGASDKPQTNYSIEYFARSIDAVMKDANVKKAVLIGHSMGTPVIRQFYRLYPEKVSALAFVDGGLRPAASKAQMEQFFAPMKTNYKQNAPQFIDGMLTPVKDENLKKEIRTAMLSTPDYVAISAMEGMIDDKNWGTDKINVPVLAIHAKSPFWTNDYEQYVRSFIPNLDYQMWEDVSHFLMMEKPDEFNKALMAFLVKNKLVEQIYVVGYVSHPVIMLFNSSMTLSQAIATADGLVANSNAEKIKVHRLRPDRNNRETFVVNLKAVLSRKANDLILQSDDIVEVPCKKCIKHAQQLYPANQLPVRVIQ